MDREYVESNDIATMYVRRELSELEAREYELFLFENPDAVQDLELEMMLSQAVGKTTIDSQPAHVSSSIDRDRGASKWFVPWLLPLAAAASIVFLGSPRFITSSLDGFDSVVPVQFRDVPIVRGAEDPDGSTHVLVADDNELRILRLPVGSPGQSFEVDLSKTDDQGERKLKQLKLISNQDGDLLLAFPGTMGVGTYLIRIPAASVELRIQVTGQ